ncbi:MAG: class I SAM-dependent methyltransferase [Spirochaetales bacterium]|nr:class I SAM-dependent methyltransferase [Spirochaetales bacterium]
MNKRSEIRNERIDQGQPFDWGRTSTEYARYRDIYPESFYEKLHLLGIGVSGQRLLDLGTGTGVVPIHLHKYGTQIVGVDISEQQIAMAAEISMNLTPAIKWIVADAADTGLAGNSFDAVAAVQCWPYFDRERTLREICRLLVPMGQMMIAFMEWLPDEDTLTRKSLDLVSRYNPHWDAHSTSRHEFRKHDFLGTAFRLNTFHTYDADLEFTRESWTGRMRACRGMAASLPASSVQEFSREHMTMLENEVPESFSVKHQIVIYVFTLLVDDQ